VGRDGRCYFTGGLRGPGRIAGSPLPDQSRGNLFLVCYVARFSPEGVLRRFVRSGGERNDLAYGIGVDASRHVYLSGAFDAVTTHGSLNAEAKGRNDIFLLKLGLE